MQSHAEKLQESADTLTAAIAKFPNNFYMHYYLGTVLAQLEERDGANEGIRAKAERAFREAIRLNATFADSYYQLSKLYMHRAPKLAEQNLVACLKLDPDHAPAEYTLGRFYLKTGRRAEGQALIDRFESQQQAAKAKELNTVSLVGASAIQSCIVSGLRYIRGLENGAKFGQCRPSDRKSSLAISVA